MKKSYLPILVIILTILAVIIIYYLTLASPFFPSGNLTESQLQENRTPFTFPFIPWQTEETGGNGEGAEGGGGGARRPGVGEETQKVNYTLTVESFPPELTVLTNYLINDIALSIEDVTPYSVKIESDTTACVLLTSSVKGGSVISWQLDGEDCEPYLCSGFIGCGIFMDNHHTVVVYYSTPS